MNPSRLGLVCFLLVLFLYCENILESSAKSFYIDYDKNTFVKDGEPFRYISGSIHSYRVPNELWEDRLMKMYAAGLNAIQIYVYWNEHEPSPGVYDFEGQNDIFSFIELAQKIGLVVILRPGPYICGEHDFGGLPWWLLANGTDNVKPRTNEQNYMNAVRRWFDQFLPRIAPYLYKNGGPIITVQVENEYGFFYACDEQYKTELKEIFIKYLGDDVVYFTTDPFGVLQCGVIPGVYPTVDFGVWQDPKEAFDGQRQYAPKGPLVNSEFYPGWLDFWGTQHQKVNTSVILNRFTQILDMDANINFYMFHGGTNWGFSNGADPPYSVQPTSYDYDAPISEAGDVTSKYMAIRETISKYSPLPPIPIPTNSTKKAYGSVQMQYINSLKDTLISDDFVNSTYPLSYEQLGQGYGIILYTTTLDNPNVDGKILSIPGIRDRGYVQIGDSPVGVLYRNNQTDLKINLKDNQETTLYIIVENMARLNFGNDIIDSKGIISNVTLDGKILTGWTSYLNDWIPNYQKKFGKDSLFKKKQKEPSFFEKFANGEIKTPKTNNINYRAPAVYVGNFKSEGIQFDTFLKMEKFTKGIALIQTVDKITNLGRYWPNEGPQVTLYTPGVFTSTLGNIVYLIEFEGSSCDVPSNCQIEFIDYPIIDSL